LDPQYHGRVNPRTATFLRALQVDVTANVFNPWTRSDPTTDLDRDASSQRLLRLKAHLSINARYVLIGEAPGYQGCKISGIPFTSERLMMEGKIPRISLADVRLSSRNRPWSEPSATIVWGTLGALGIADRSVLWNAYPWHPHKPGVLHSNRTPTLVEREAGLQILEKMLNLYPAAQVFAVGRNAEAALAKIGRPAIGLRHPSMGGARTFASQLCDAVQENMA
jgi:uracil-DNA glycosylase